MSDKDFIKRFEAFAKSKPAGERYRASSSEKCALAQFGYPDATSFNLARLGIPEEAYRAALGEGDEGLGDTVFGALADRLARLSAPLREGL
jgi:hypothetical protein